MSLEQKGVIARVTEKAAFLLPFHKYNYGQFESEAKSLPDDKLVAKRHEYDHVTRDTTVRTVLGMGATLGGTFVLGPHLPREVMLYVAPSVLALGVCFIGPNRGIVRESKRDILDEEIKSRGLKPQETVVYQSKV